MDGSVNLLLLVLLCLALGAAAGVWATRSWAAARVSGVLAERDLLRERVLDAEAEASHDRELAAVLGPLKDSLTRVERQVGVLERDRVEQYAQLGEQLAAVTRSGEAITKSGEALRSETASLVGALRSSSTRGTWGETQLRRVVEHAGMLAKVDFLEQPTGTSPEGAALRPDLQVQLPGGKNLLVDAKAPLAAFLDAGVATDSVAQQALYAAHAKALRGHVDVLASKAYWAAFQPTPEMIVCFVPGDAILAAALQADPGLHEVALSRKVILASPGTLMALLRTVSFTWQQQALAGNARELFEVGRELYTRLGTLGTHSTKLGRSLHRAVEDYNALIGTLERRVLVTARKMHDLDLTDQVIPEVSVVEATPRSVTAYELLDGVR